MLSTRHLGTAKPPWVVVSPCDAETLRLVVRREFPDLLIATISGRACQTKRGLFRAFGDVLHFPDYFGKNWDAFEECINDLSWLKADGYLLIVSDAERLLARNAEDLRAFVSIMKGAGREWAANVRCTRAFHVVLATTSSASIARRRWRLHTTDLALSAR